MEPVQLFITCIVDTLYPKTGEALVTNQPPPFETINLYDNDAALIGAVEAAGGEVQGPRLSAFGERCGSAEVLDWAQQANNFTPQLKSFDRYGHRLDEVEFHPAYHALMDLGLGAGVSAGAWTADQAGLCCTPRFFLMGQAEGGVCCSACRVGLFTEE